MLRTTRQLDFIRDCLEAGARQVSGGKPDSPAADVEVVEVTTAPLRELGEDSLFGDGDRVAGLSSSLRGSLFGTALFAMEPEDAFAWVLSKGSGPDPLESYVAAGAQILRAMIQETGVSLNAPVELGETTLREESLMEILVGTHAPSDTLLVSAKLLLRAAGLTLPASFYVLVAPKQLDQLASRLAS